MRRASEVVERRLKAEVAEWQRKMQPYSKLLQAFDSEFWGLVVERLNKTAANIAAEREENFEKMTETELKVSIARETTIKDVIRLPARERSIQLRIAERLAVEREKLRNYQNNKR